MDEIDPKTGLISAGLEDYWPAKQALNAFETLIGTIARDAILGHFEELKAAIGQTDLSEQNIQVGLPAESDRVGVGAVMPAAGTWGIRVGIRWPVLDERSAPPVACLAVRVSAAWKTDKLLRALVRGGKDDIRIEAISGWPHEVHLSRPLSPGATPDALREALDDVVSSFVELTSKAGGLRDLITS